MSNSEEKGKFSTEIASDVIEAALKSVAKHTAPEIAFDDSGATDTSAELLSLKEQLDLSQAKGRELMEKLKDEHEKMLRAAADLENYKKRAAKEREEMQKYGVEKLLKDFLPVLDNLDRALAHADAVTSDAAGLKSGVEMVRKLFESSLQKHGIAAFTSLGKPFDPHFHEAMQQIATQDIPVGHVAMELVRGFTLHGRLVRPALVAVAIAPPEPGSEHS